MALDKWSLDSSMIYPWLFWAVLCCPTQVTYVLKSLDPEPAGHLSLELSAPGTRSSLTRSSLCPSLFFSLLSLTLRRLCEMLVLFLIDHVAWMLRNNGPAGSLAGFLPVGSLGTKTSPLLACIHAGTEGRKVLSLVSLGCVFPCVHVSYLRDDTLTRPGF